MRRIGIETGRRSALYPALYRKSVSDRCDLPLKDRPAGFGTRAGAQLELHPLHLRIRYALVGQVLKDTPSATTFTISSKPRCPTSMMEMANSFRKWGCPYPYHYKAASGEIVALQIDGYPLGVRSDTKYPVIETQLHAGDRIVFCSDGIIEASNSAYEMFGFERTAETIQQGCEQQLSAPQLLGYLISEVQSFTGDVVQGARSDRSRIGG